MSAPSTYTSNPYDNRDEPEALPVRQTTLEVLTDWAENSSNTRRYAGSFAARYRGQCGSCDTPVDPGDEIQYGLDDVIEHVQCPDEAPPRPVCGDCYLELPLSGVCGVCE